MEARKITKQSEEVLELVTFRVGGEEFGMPILEVREINRMMGITRVPHAPSFLEGVVNLRGQVIPVVDLRRRFALPEIERTGENRIVVVDRKDKVVGFVVDAVNQVLRVPAVVEPPDPLLSSEGSAYIKGIVKLPDRLLILLDTERLLTAEEGEGLENLAA